MGKGIRKCTDVEEHHTVLSLSGRDLITLHNALGMYLKNHVDGVHEIECEDCRENGLELFERVLEKTETMEEQFNGK